MTTTIEAPTSAPTLPVAYLTPVERRVLGALTHDGADNKTVARRCGITEDTVKTHIRHILAKVRAALDLPAATSLTRTSLVVALLKRRVTVTVCLTPHHHEPFRNCHPRCSADHVTHVCNPYGAFGPVQPHPNRRSPATP